MPALPGVGHHRDRGPDQHEQRRDQDHDRGHLHLEGLDLLAEVLRRAPDHQAGDEHRDDREHQHAVQARADAAEDHLAELYQPHRHQTAERRAANRASRSTAPHEAAVVIAREQRRIGDAEAHLLAFHVAARLQVLARLIDAQRGQRRIAAPARPTAPPRATPRRSPPSHAASPSPGGRRRPCARTRSTAPRGSASIAIICRKFVSGVGFSYGCAELALKKPPPLVPSILIASCEATGPMARVCVSVSAGSLSALPCRVLERLPGSVEPRFCVAERLEHARVLVGSKFWITPCAMKERQQQRHRQQHVQRGAGRSTQKLPMALRRTAREAADQREGHRDAGRGGEEILHRQAEHLRQIAHRRLAAHSPASWCWSRS